jgi:hypothetical protein
VEIDARDNEYAMVNLSPHCHLGTYYTPIHFNNMIATLFLFVMRDDLYTYGH